MYNLSSVNEFLIGCALHIGKNILIPEQSTADVVLDQRKHLLKNELASVTQAHCKVDDDAQEYFLENLLKKYPHSRIIVEEITPSVSQFAKDSENCFIVDCLDGTSKYGEGSCNFGVSLGYSHNDSLQVGVVYLPRHELMFYAIKNKGAWCDSKKLEIEKVYTINEGDKIVLNSKIPITIDDIFSKAGINVLRPHCTVYGMSRLFLNEARAYVALNTNVHDMAPSAFILEEAGGVSGRFDGSKLDVRQKSRIADFIGSTSKEYRDAILKIHGFVRS